MPDDLTTVCHPLTCCPDRTRCSVWRENVGEVEGVVLWHCPLAVGMGECGMYRAAQ